MASRYWIGGTATWDATAGLKWSTSSGGLPGAAVPTNADTVFFDASSGVSTVTLSSSSTAAGIDCTGFTGTLSHPAATTISLGSATLPTGNVALKLVAGMTYTLGDAATSALTFASTNATQQTITTGGKVMGNVTISGAGSSYQLSDAFTATGGTLGLSTGTLDTNGQTITASNFSSNTASNRTFTMGSSTFNLSLAGTAWSARATNLTVSANTATVNITGASATFQPAGNGAGAGINWNGLSVVVSGSGACGINDGTATSGSTVANFTRTGTALKTDSLVLTLANTFTISGTGTFNGNSTTNRLLIASSAVGTARTLSIATLSTSNTDWRDVTAAGAASWNLSAITGNSGDCGGNTGITFTTPSTQTRSGAGGNWSTAANWTSRVPLPQDPVIVNGSASGTITSDMPRIGSDLDFTGFGGTWTFTSGLNTQFYGGLKTVSGMTISNAGLSAWAFLGRGTCNLTSGGKQWPLGANGNTFSINGPGGTFTQQDALTINSSSTSSGFILTSGTYSTNNFDLTVRTFTSTGTVTRSFTGGTSIVNLTGSASESVMNLASTGLTWSASSTTFKLTATSASTRTFTGGGLTFGTLDYTVAGSTGQLTVASSNTFGAINFTDSTNARTLSLTSGTTTTISNGTLFNVNGTSGKLMSIISTSAGTPATLAVTTNNISVDFVSVKDSTVTTTTPAYAGNNSTNVSGNTNWTFTAPPSGGNQNLLMLGIG